MYSDEPNPRDFQPGRDREDATLAAYVFVIEAALQTQANLAGMAASKLKDELVKAKAVLESQNPQ